MNNSIISLGLMSGTSLDGLDIALCKFTHTDENWTFTILDADTITYSPQLYEALKSAENFTAEAFMKLDKDYGYFLGDAVNTFLKTKNVKPDIIASHGQTIFHQPEENFTVQIGSGAHIAARTGIITISDFRTLNVALGGQGAPLVPIGDMLLFAQYDYCLNIGGFANISYEKNGVRCAFDTSPANMILNHYANMLHKPYDNKGEIGRQGTINKALLKALNGLQYYHQAPPKSLGKEWLDLYMKPLLETSQDTPKNILATLYEHIAQQVALSCDKKGSIIITGGGAMNTYLVERIRTISKMEVIVPDQNIIDFKEALIFAFLGVLRWWDMPNCLSSYTGSSQDNLGGIIHKI